MKDIKCSHETHLRTVTEKRLKEVVYYAYRENLIDKISRNHGKKQVLKEPVRILKPLKWVVISWIGSRYGSFSGLYSDTLHALCMKNANVILVKYFMKLKKFNIPYFCHFTSFILINFWKFCRRIPMLQPLLQNKILLTETFCWMFCLLPAATTSHICFIFR